MSATPMFSVADLAARRSFDAGAWSWPSVERSSVLELLTSLQTTLDVTSLLAIFSDHLQNVIGHDGVGFTALAGTVGQTDRQFGVGRREGAAWRLLLFVGGRELGWLEIFVQESPLPAQQTLADPLISCLVHPLHNAVRFARLSDQALLDDLTGIGNRAAFTRSIGHEIARAERAGGAMSLSLMILDLDRFKQLNDVMGHLVGDRALRQLAEAASASLRDADRLFRYGGDEFVALLPDANLKGATVLAERLEREIALNCREPQLHITAGVAEWSPGMAPEALFELADQALYARKRQKRELA